VKRPPSSGGPVGRLSQQQAGCRSHGLTTTPCSTRQPQPAHVKRTTPSAAVEPGAKLHAAPPGTGRSMAGGSLDRSFSSGETVDAAESPAARVGTSAWSPPTAVMVMLGSVGTRRPGPSAGSTHRTITGGEVHLPCWWQRTLPSGGQQNCPLGATCRSVRHARWAPSRTHSQQRTRGCALGQASTVARRHRARDGSGPIQKVLSKRPGRTFWINSKSPSAWMTPA